MTIELNEPDRNYIKEFTDEVMTLYEADEECLMPQYIEDMARNVYVILGYHEEAKQEEY